MNEFNLKLYVELTERMAFDEEAGQNLRTDVYPWASHAIRLCQRDA